MAIEIVDFPIKNDDFPQLFVCLPEGNHYYQKDQPSKNLEMFDLSSPQKKSFFFRQIMTLNPKLPKPSRKPGPLRMSLCHIQTIYACILGIGSSSGA